MASQARSNQRTIYGFEYGCVRHRAQRRPDFARVPVARPVIAAPPAKRDEDPT